MSKIMIGTDEVLKVMFGLDEVSSLSMGGETIPITPPTPPAPVYSAMPLTIEMLSGGTFFMKSRTGRHINYSINGGTPIEKKFVSGDITLEISGLNAGDKIEFTVSKTQAGIADINYPAQCSADTQFNVYGNLLSLMYVDYEAATSLSGNGCFNQLFYKSPVVDASNLILPDVSLTDRCCNSMFQSSSVVYGPQLLPSTLVIRCYQTMFNGDNSLESIKCLAADGFAETNCLNAWVSNVNSSGTFVKAAGVSWPSGNNGIPTGWTVVDA